VVQGSREMLAAADVFWWRWVTDIGIPRPDRGEGGKYLFVGPDYAGSLPTEGYFLRHCRTNQLAILGRAFLENKDPGGIRFENSPKVLSE
jgi:hypothetical protein